MAHTHFYLISELLGCIKGPVLQIQGYRLSMTPSNSRTPKRSYSEVPVLIG